MLHSNSNLERRIKIEFNSSIFSLGPKHDGSTPTWVDGSLVDFFLDCNFLTSSLHVIVFIQHNGRGAIKVNDNGEIFVIDAVGQSQCAKVASKIAADVQKQDLVSQDVGLDLGGNRHGRPVKVGIPVLNGCEQNVKATKVHANQQTHDGRAEVDIIHTDQIPILFRVLLEICMKDRRSVLLSRFVEVTCQVYRLQGNVANQKLDNILDAPNPGSENNLIIHEFSLFPFRFHLVQVPLE